ncbi:DUF3134 domain-containing protein [Leptolyngbya sp. FACHB-261]|uniref:DUF3134 domain-containing protein n=1 Tax=Leptolyngbya sp. FACHB-261 TaxID=2692806 RepID=UPI001688AE07|nr:DUF3134 domain-containing protein [Leptolyngbya sp. FACHB-261]MBD2103717.1 DUF3134 domain-containing protein [Leptolyngbya sp. FACHB-261]
MSTLNNPSLREEPRRQRAEVIPSNRDSSILDWLEKSGRLMAREPDERSLAGADYRDDEEELNDLMAGDDGGYLDDDSDDADLED